jgi:hypothetical protein
MSPLHSADSWLLLFGLLLAVLLLLMVIALVVRC